MCVCLMHIFLFSVWPLLSIHASMFQKVAKKKKKQVDLILELLIRNEPDSKNRPTSHMNIDFNQSELKQNHPSIPCCFCLTPSWPSVHPVFCIHVKTAYIYIHVLLYLCGLACTSICSSIHTSIYLSMHHSPYYGNASFIIHLLPLLVHFHPLISHDCVCVRQRGLVTAVIGTGVSDERGTLGSIPKTILILAHPAMQVMHSLTTSLKHIPTMTALLSALSERERCSRL